MKGWVYNWVFWIPRVLAILFIMFLMLFSLDVYSEGVGFWQLIGGLLVHNIPAFILIIVLYFSWRYELVGAITFTLLSIGCVIFIKKLPIIIYCPMFIIGVLFFLDWYVKRTLDRRKIIKNRRTKK